MDTSELFTTTPSGKKRARGLNLPLPGRPGPTNAITDVAGVEVGYCTPISGDVEQRRDAAVDIRRRHELVTHERLGHAPALMRGLTRLRLRAATGP